MRNFFGALGALRAATSKALEPLGKFGPAAVDARGVSSQNFGVTSLVQF